MAYGTAEDVDRAVIESAKGMGLNASQRLLKIELPLAWPIILTGIRVATLLNIGIAAIAPLVGGTGLGLLFLGAGALVGLAGQLLQRFHQRVAGGADQRRIVLLNDLFQGLDPFDVGFQ